MRVAVMRPLFRRRGGVVKCANCDRWNGRIVFYPGGVLVGPDSIHDGPDSLWIGKGGRGYYRWEVLASGQWSLVGPLRDLKVRSKMSRKLQNANNKITIALHGERL